MTAPSTPAAKLSDLKAASLCLIVLGTLLMFAGCSRIPGLGRFAASSGSLKATGETTGNTLAPHLDTIAYIDRGQGEADVYLTDLTSDELDPATPLDELTGSIIHIKLFLKPKAGRTPIEPTASSAMVRQLVLANGAIGLYGGGGFIFQRGSAGDRSVGGSIANATLKLVRSTPDFADQLGTVDFTGSFTARLNPEQAEQLADLMTDAQSYTQRVEPVLIHADAGP